MDPFSSLALRPSETRGSAPDPGGSPPDLSGRTLGDFHLLRRLGQGGMGQVYLAEQNSLKRKVAVKIMRPEQAVQASALQRFQAEAEAVARLTHPNIVQVYAFGEEAGLCYMALEYVEGHSLREYLDRKGPPDLPLALSILRQVAAALQRAAELGIIHRDIKPANILLTRRGEAKVADFGLARCFGSERPAGNLTQSGVALGTPLYMSPEQLQGQPIDPRTDLYSLGITCYHMLAGRPPFRGQNAFELALHHVQTEPPPLAELRPDLPAELCAIVHKMIAKEPAQRHANGAELLQDLARLRESLAGRKGSGSAASDPAAASGSRVRHRRWRGAVAASLLAALLGGATLARLRSPPAVVPPPLPDAEVVLPAATEQQKQEKFLREAVEQYANPGGDRARLELGIRHGLELGLFYLKQQRLDDAEAFFTELIRNPAQVPAYRTLGRLGQAIVLARQDRARESNEAFRAVLRERSREGKPADRLPFLLNQASLRYEIGRALDRNKANAAGQPLPPELERLRNPPQLAAKQTAAPAGARQP